jgi:hypothetical protein
LISQPEFLYATVSHGATGARPASPLEKGTRMHALGRGALAAAGLALAGCAPTVWSKPGATASDRDAALAACEAYADRRLSEDFPSRIEETHRGIGAGEDESVLLSDFRRFDERARRTDFFEACMRQNGYIEAPLENAGGAENGAPADAS